LQKVRLAEMLGAMVAETAIATAAFLFEKAGRTTFWTAAAIFSART